MATNYYEIEDGLELNLSVFLADPAATPGGTPSTDEVGIGSYYLCTTTGDMWTKVLAGTGSNKWRKMATQEYVDAQVANQISWREPVQAHDSTSTTIPAAATNTIDGETVFDGMRVLFSNQTITTDQNIWVASGTTGNWTWTEDTNAETKGDITYVDGGTDIGKQYVYNGTSWVLLNASSSTELQYIRDFIGKAASGAENTGYISNNYIVDGDNLELAIGKLDAQIGVNATNITNIGTDITNINAELSFIRAFIGKDAAGSEFPDYTSNNYIVDGDNLELAISKLDVQIGINAGDIATLQSEMLETRTETQASNVTTPTIIDCVNVDLVAAVKWIVYTQGTAGGDAAKKYTIEVLATHDGHNVSGGADATDIDRAIGPKLKIGPSLGVKANVVLQGTGAAQTMCLQIEASTAVDVKAIREIVLI